MPINQQHPKMVISKTPNNLEKKLLNNPHITKTMNHFIEDRDPGSPGMSIETIQMHTPLLTKSPTPVMTARTEFNNNPPSSTKNIRSSDFE